jgi:hypothetical protein
MRRSRIVLLCSTAALALAAMAASGAQAKDVWAVEGATLAAGLPPTHGKQVEVTAVEPGTIEVPAIHELIECKKAEYLGSGGTGHAYIYNVKIGFETIGRQEGLLNFKECKNINKPGCSVTAVGTLNTGQISGSLVNEIGGTKKVYDMLVQEKWSEASPAYSTFEPFMAIVQTGGCFSGTLTATGLAGEVFNEKTEGKVHTLEFLGKPACGRAPISEVELSSGPLDKIAMRDGTMAAEACIFFNLALVSGENWSVKT